MTAIILSVPCSRFRIIAAIVVRGAAFNSNNRTTYSVHVVLHIGASNKP